MNSREEILDLLFTLRWTLSQKPAKVDDALKVLNEAIKEVTGNDETEDAPPADPKDTGTPKPNDDVKAILGIVVGHERKAPGADFKLGGSEYDFNSDIAARVKEYAGRKYPNIKVEIIYRDGVGISGAYRKAKALKVDACIELHFNAYNGQAQGTETLCTSDYEDRKFAGFIHSKICAVFQRAGQSRGVKALPRSARGGQSLYAMTGVPNCLVEPFFGDNINEAKMANDNRVPYAMALIDGAAEYFKHHGLS